MRSSSANITFLDATTNTILKLKNDFIKFIAVGVLNTVFGYSLFAILLAFKINYIFALALSTIAGILFNFKTFGKIVFSSNDNKRIFKFILVYALVYIINICGISFFVFGGKSPLVGGAVMLIPCALISFILQKKVVYNNE